MHGDSSGPGLDPVLTRSTSANIITQQQQNTPATARFAGPPAEYQTHQSQFHHHWNRARLELSLLLLLLLLLLLHSEAKSDLPSVKWNSMRIPLHLTLKWGWGGVCLDYRYGSSQKKKRVVLGISRDLSRLYISFSLVSLSRPDRLSVPCPNGEMCAS